MSETRILLKRQVKNMPVVVKALLILVLLGFLMFVYNRADAKAVSMDTILASMNEKTDIAKMKRCDKRDLMQFLGLDYQDYQSYLYFKSKESLGAEEVLIIRVKKTSDLDGVKDAVDSRIRAQEKAFDGYGTTQMQQLGNAVVETKGDYLFYCVAEDPDTYKEVFRDAVQ